MEGADDEGDESEVTVLRRTRVWGRAVVAMVVMSEGARGSRE
jgi:hypothetical protein